MSPLSISVVIVAYREREALAEAIGSCLPALAAVPGGAELIVVDNGGLTPFIRERWPDVGVLESAGNAGFAGGVRRGIAAARGDWIALLNDDARIEREALGRLLAAGERDGHIGSVAAQVRFHSDPAVINSAGIEVDSLGVAAERLAGCPIGAAAVPGEVFGACGCFALYRRAMLDEVGGLAEDFVAYLEDVDLAWRARAAGWSAMYEPAAIAYHRGSATLGEGSARKYFLVGRNRVRLLARNATRPQLLRALPAIVLYDLAYVTYVALTDRTLAPLRGRLAGLREWRKARASAPAPRRKVVLSPALRGWLLALRQHRAYRRLGSQEGAAKPH